MSVTYAGPTRRFAMEHGVLRGVRIDMKDGRKLVGYVGWSPDFFKYEKEPKFPQSLLDPTAWLQETKTLELRTRLYPVSRTILRRAFPDGDGSMRMVIATGSGTLTLPTKQIVRIKALRMKYDGIDATIDGLITYIRSRAIIRLLMSGRPFATFMNFDGHVLVSFNRQVGRNKLASIDAVLTRLRTSDSGANAWERARSRLYRRRVVLLDFVSED